MGGARDARGVVRKREVQTSAVGRRKVVWIGVGKGNTSTTEKTTCSTEEKTVAEGAMASRVEEERSRGHGAGKDCVLQHGIEQKRLGSPRLI